jgi:hypothetical protein
MHQQKKPFQVDELPQKEFYDFEKLLIAFVRKVNMKMAKSLNCKNADV